MWLILVLPFFVVASIAVPLILPKSVFYHDGRPTHAGRVANRVSQWYAAASGPPSWQVSLETRGRKSGRTIKTAIAIARCDGADYLVSMLGEKSAWVRNVRAAGGEAAIRHGRKRRVRLDEIPPSERAPVLKAYCARARSGRRHFQPLTPESSIGEFAAVADRYPVFRIVEIT